MRELYTLTSFNIKKMIKTWPIWFFSFLLLILVGGGLYYLSNTNKVDLLINIEDKSVDISSIYDSPELRKNYNINQIKEEKRKPQKNEISVYINPIDKNSSNIKFKYGTNVTKDNSFENYFISILQNDQLNTLVRQYPEVIREYKIENTSDEKLFSSQTLSFIALFLTYGFTLLCGATITNSVASEKISKVSDLIIYRTNPVKLIYGKILALFVVVGMIICAVALELWGVIKFNDNIKNNITAFLKNIDISWQNVSLVLVMSACAIIIYTLLYAVVGMFVQDQQQLQFAQLPVTLVLIITFVSTYFAILHPNTVISNVGVYIPLMSPFIFVDKVLNGFTQIELWGFIGTEILFLLLCNFVIMRIFIPKKYY